MGTRSAPIDIASSSRARDHSCAFPSWPRRASFAESAADEPARASSFFSDDDILFSLEEDSFVPEDDARSISSVSSTSSSPADFLALPHAPPTHNQPNEFDLQRQRLEMLESQNHAIREKERRKNALKQQRRAAALAERKKQAKVNSMAPIAE